MMETYAERLQKEKENKMPIDDMDETFVEEPDAKWQYDHEKCTEQIDFDISQKTLVSLALKAHEEEITLNHLINLIIRDKLKDFEYQFENGTKPQILKEY